MLSFFTSFANASIEKAKASVACNADGVMLEFHPDPKNAAVDPLQPL